MITTPSVALPIIGSICAAAIAGITSFLVAVLSKEAKISDFRQKWIDELRADLAEFLSMVGTMGTHKKNRNQSSAEAQVQFFEESIERHIRLDTIYVRILLRLNREEHTEMMSLLNSAKIALKNDANKPEYLEEILNLSGPIIEGGQDIFKSEWRRVKRGETIFVITKWASIGISITALLSIAIMYFFNLKLISIID